MRVGSRCGGQVPMSMPESVPPTRRVGRAMAWGVAIGVGAVVFRELVRPREQTARLIDWERVEQIALNRCGEAADLPEDAGREQTYQAIAAELEPLLTEALGAGTASAGSRLYPGVTAGSRRQWVRFNIRIFRQMFEPLESLQQLIPGSLIVSFGQKGISRYLGLMLGLLARRGPRPDEPPVLGPEPAESAPPPLGEPDGHGRAEK